MTRKKHGFTLIELLVVISIIALLVAILMPALNAARQQATGAVCQSNLKGLTTAYLMYAVDYNDGLVGGYVPNTGQTTQWNKNYNQWVYPAFDSVRFATGAYTKAFGDPGWREKASKTAPSLQDRITGLKMGAMWKYAKSHEIYNCPGDKRSIKGSSGTNLPKEHQYIYRTYSLPDGLAGHKNLVEYYPLALTKTTEIKRAAESYVFVEEQMHGDQNFNFNHGGWSFQPWNPNRNYHMWWDTLGTFHNNVAEFSFADGHVEGIKWMHKETSEGFKTNFYYGTSARNLAPIPNFQQNKDFQWLWQNYPDKKPFDFKAL